MIFATSADQSKACPTNAAVWRMVLGQFVSGSGISCAYCIYIGVCFIGSIAWSGAAAMPFMPCWL